VPDFELSTLRRRTIEGGTGDDSMIGSAGADKFWTAAWTPIRFRVAQAMTSPYGGTGNDGWRRRRRTLCYLRMAFNTATGGAKAVASIGDTVN
jgi:hypothetical protein